MKQNLIVAVVVALMVSASEAQLDSCEGCLSTLAQVADWGQTNIDGQLELLLAQVCKGDPDCEAAYGQYWPDVSKTLFGPENQAVTVQELCKLGLHCTRHRSWKQLVKEYTDCATCEADMVTLGDLFQHPNVIAHLDSEIKKLYCSTFGGPEHADCEHFVNDWAEQAFQALGQHLGATGSNLCQDIFDCAEEPTEEPTEGPTEEPTESPID